MASSCGIQFDTKMMTKFGVNPDLPPEQYFSASLHDANAMTRRPQATGSEKQPVPSAIDKTSDEHAASSSIHDELVRIPLWWILEVIPMTFAWQDRKGNWREKREFHLGRGRYSNDTDPLLFHETVRTRIQNTSLKYKPKLKYDEDKVKYVW